MAVRCEYCGQLYEGLSCPHCCAPRGESEEDECVEHDCDPTMTVGDFYGILDSIKETCDPEWILTNSSCVGDNNVQVMGNNNEVNCVFYADDVPYYVHPEVWPEDQPSERQETIGTTVQAKKHGRWLRWTVITIICAWFGVFGFGVLIGNSVDWSVCFATVFCVGIGCCLATGYKE